MQLSLLSHNFVKFDEQAPELGSQTISELSLHVTPKEPPHVSIPYTALDSRPLVLLLPGFIWPGVFPLQRFERSLCFQKVAFWHNWSLLKVLTNPGQVFKYSM
jgi:hypothetical protein